MNPPVPHRHLKPQALYEEVAELLRQRIFNRELGPGAWIDELKIAAEYGISRTPLREAIKVLAAEGLITMKLRRGAYVTEVSEQDLAQVFHLMTLLESDAASAAAAQANASQMAELEKLHAVLEGSTHDREAFFSVNEAFHQKLLEVGNNRWRDQIVADLRKVMKLNRHHSLLKKGRIKESLAEHRVLMQALKNRDAPSAAAAMRRHIENGQIAAL